MSAWKDRIYHLEGSPFAIGYRMGQLLGSKLEANIDRYVRERVTQDISFDIEKWRLGALPWLLNLPERFLSELNGLAQGADLSLQRLAEWAYLEAFLSGQCSGAILTIDQQVWVARNNDIFVPDMWGYVTIREVTGRVPTISFGLEGDVFTPTGINQEKLWLHYNYVPAVDAPDERHTFLPCYAFMVEALETCRTLADLESLLTSLHRDDGMLLFAVDGKDNAFAVYECGRADFYKRQAAIGWVVGTNHYCIYPNAPSISGSTSTMSRYQRIEALVKSFDTQSEKATPVKGLIQVLADDGVEVRNGDIITSYANVACPGMQEIWYTFGRYPAASCGNWQKLEWPW
ncbi:MAG TPA: C45 family autoproteolytic acyltransferase/hydrolase [Anaerolineaceae bacterium]|nr:C45 family autoproteolytic acyltransferase/hydrolase [Anaerolineaceae bacterium]